MKYTGFGVVRIISNQKNTIMANYKVENVKKYIH